MNKRLAFIILILAFILIIGCTNSSEVEYSVTGTATDVDIMVYYSEGYRDKTESFNSVSLPWSYKVDVENDEGLLGEEHSDSLYICINKKNNDNIPVTASIKAEGSDKKSATVSVPYGNLCVSSEVLVDTAPTLD